MAHVGQAPVQAVGQRRDATLCKELWGREKERGTKVPSENPTYSKTFTTYCWGPVNAGTVSTRYTSSQSLKKLL